MTPEELLRELREPEHWQALRAPRSGRSAARARPTASRVLPVAAAFVVVILAVTGIAVGFASLHREGAPAATATPSRTPEAISSPSPLAAFSGVVAGATRTRTPSQYPPACTFAQLQVSADRDGGGAAGTYIHAVYVRDVGEACILQISSVVVGAQDAPLKYQPGFEGGVLEPGDVAALVVSVAESCGQEGTVSNIDRAHPVPISLRSGGALQGTGVTFPRTSAQSCFSPYVDASLDTDQGSRFGTPVLTATPSPVTYSDGDSVQYSMELRYGGAAPIVLGDCPRAIETIRDAGDTVTRSLTLTCALGATLRPGATSTVRVTAPVPTPFANGITVSWFIPQVSASSSAFTTCTLAQLRFSGDGEMGGEVGNWFQHLRVQNAGDACELPGTALTIGSRIASGALALPGHATSTVRITAAQRCGDATDSANVPVAVTSGQPDAKQHEAGIAVSLGGSTTAVGVLFPILACSPASVELQSQ